MVYLYGDSSASPLKVNFIDLLRHAIELSVELVRAEHRMLAEEEYRRELRERSDGDATALKRLEDAIARAARDAAPAEASQPAVRCAAMIASAVTEAVKSEMRGVQATLAEELGRIDTNVKREVEVCRTALGRFLMGHDLPEATVSLSMDARGAQSQAQVRGRAFGVETTIELDIPLSLIHI